MLRLPVTTVGTVGGQLALQTAAGLIGVPAEATAPGLQGELTILPEKQFPDQGPGIFHRSVQQRGQLARLTGPDDAQLIIVPRGVHLPERVALVLRLETSAEKSSPDAPGHADCCCPNFDPQEIRALFELGFCPP